ncbi:MAG TPA: CHASE3 domain-containing protein [Methylomirabilota bacterium]|nr:CHASE3 domain-containing protein [Methylomirabilota bacterium]
MIPSQNIRKMALWLGIILPAFALLAAVWVAHLTSGQVNTSFDSVTRTYKVISLIEETQAHIADAETGRRGYLQTGRENYSRLRVAALASVNDDLQQLEDMIRNNHVQKANLEQLQLLISNRLDSVSANAVEIKPAADLSAVALTDEGMETMKQVRSLLFQMRAEETDLLTQRQKDTEDRVLFDQTISLAFVALTAFALIAVVAAMLRLEHLRRIVTICAWTGQVKDEGQWVPMEDYLKNRFGVAISHGVSKEAAEKMMQESRRPASTMP